MSREPTGVQGIPLSSRSHWRQSFQPCLLRPQSPMRPRRCMKVRTAWQHTLPVPLESVLQAENVQRVCSATSSVRASWKSSNLQGWSCCLKQAAPVSSPHLMKCQYLNKSKQGQYFRSSSPTHSRDLFELSESTKMLPATYWTMTQRAQSNMRTPWTLLQRSLAD